MDKKQRQVYNKIRFSIDSLLFIKERRILNQIELIKLNGLNKAKEFLIKG